MYMYFDCLKILTVPEAENLFQLLWQKKSTGKNISSHGNKKDRFWELAPKILLVFHDYGNVERVCFILHVTESCQTSFIPLDAPWDNIIIIVISI